MCLSAASARQRRDYTFQITDKWEIIAETEILQVKSRRSRDSAQIEARYNFRKCHSDFNQFSGKTCFKD